jgi:hypothetical protein
MKLAPYSFLAVRWNASPEFALAFHNICDEFRTSISEMAVVVVADLSKVLGLHVPCNQMGSGKRINF